MKIEPKCLSFNRKINKGAAYTSDGFMLPCCWLDDPNAYKDVVRYRLKDESLKLSNNKSLVQIFGSDQWENFFTDLFNNPANAPFKCKNKCGVSNG